MQIESVQLRGTLPSGDAVLRITHYDLELVTDMGHLFVRARHLATGAVSAVPIDGVESIQPLPEPSTSGGVHVERHERTRRRR